MMSDACAIIGLYEHVSWEERLGRRKAYGIRIGALCVRGAESQRHHLRETVHCRIVSLMFRFAVDFHVSITAYTSGHLERQPAQGGELDKQP
ncbi:hypothetical protein DF042_01840 [Burkholderia cenocepacia]|nr:hypothetical protein DF042_01840 [Burkholderia cenocepacia]